MVDFTAITAYAYPKKTVASELRDQLNTIRSRYKQAARRRTNPKPEEKETPSKDTPLQKSHKEKR